MYKLDEIDPTFAQDLKDSERYVDLVAGILAEKGYEVRVPREKIRDPDEPPCTYSDKGDIFIKRPGESEFLKGPVEVKKRSFAFSSKDDYPFPDVMLDGERHWKSLEDKPVGYVILDNDASHAAVVYGRTSDQWESRRNFVRKGNREKNLLFCPTNLAQFVKVKGKVH